MWIYLVSFTAALLSSGIGCMEKVADDSGDSGLWSGPIDADGDGYYEDYDCDDSDPGVNASATEIAHDGVDQDCDGEDLLDGDGDGHVADFAGGDDCDDSDPDSYPGAVEQPYDGVDQDCDGQDLVDRDGDGHAASGHGGEDCDDSDPDVHPDMLDDCDGGDEDCDGLLDEDADQDSDGVSVCDGDCDDLDAAVAPSAEEVPQDGVDQDCDGYDQGNCEDEVYSEGWLVTVEFHASDCTESVSYGGTFSEEPFYVQPDATCGPDGLEWGSGWLSFRDGDYKIDGSFTLDDAGVYWQGTFWGEMYIGGEKCDSAYGDIWLY